MLKVKKSTFWITAMPSLSTPKEKGKSRSLLLGAVGILAGIAWSALLMPGVLLFGWFFQPQILVSPNVSEPEILNIFLTHLLILIIILFVFFALWASYKNLVFVRRYFVRAVTRYFVHAVRRYFMSVC